ncbi:hypothetical protein [Thiohalospira sp.]|uniref:HvfA family oxazolone/thioamide-modified RiPP metallophore n=1 Tax=Thiohalospira sp. TaxID=3080549 RepID=UPI00397F8A20
MSDHRSSKPVSAALGTAFAASLAAGGASADTGANPFGLTDLGSGFQVAESEGRCGEGKCGGDKKKDAEGKCGGDKKGDKKKDAEGKCGGDKKGDKKKDAEGKCGEGKCGGSR